MSHEFQAINTVLLAVLNSLWMVTAVAAAAALVMRAIPGVNAATRYAVWWSVLAVVLALPLAMIAHSLPVRSMAPGEVAATTELPPTASSYVAPANRVVPEPVLSSPVAPSTRLIELRASSWPAWIFALWTAVFLFHLARIAWSYLYLRGVAKRAHTADRMLRADFDRCVRACDVRRPVRLLLSNEVRSPMAIGFLNPAVILPERLLSQLDPNDLDHVLLHELAHVARYDDWTKLAAHLASATLFLHPVAAWILRRIEREREIACDDWVVATTGTAQPYAVSLARLLELCVARRRDLLAAGLAGRSSHLRVRIERLLNGTAMRTTARTPKASRVRIAVCAAMLVIVVAAGARSPRWIAFAQPAPAASSSTSDSSFDAAALSPDPDAQAPAAKPAAPSPVAPPLVPALAPRVQQYYAFMQQSRYSDAALFVTKATRNNFLNTHRNSFLSVKVEKVQLLGGKAANGPYRAEVTVVIEAFPLGAVSAVHASETTTWEQVGKSWYLEAPVPHVATFEELTAGGKDSKAAPADVKFATLESDMGKLKHGETGEAVFPFENTTHHPVTLEVTTYCECLAPKDLKKKYLPGETGELRLTFNSRDYLDDYAQTITVKTLPGGGTTNVHVKGFVTRPGAETPESHLP